MRLQGQIEKLMRFSLYINRHDLSFLNIVPVITDQIWNLPNGIGNLMAASRVSTVLQTSAQRVLDRRHALDSELISENES